MTALWANFNEQAGSDDMEEYCRGIPVSIIKPWLQQVNCANKQISSCCHHTFFCCFYAADLPKFRSWHSLGIAGHPPHAAAFALHCTAALALPRGQQTHAVRSSQVCNTLSPVESAPEKPSCIRVGTLDAELEPLILSKAAQHGLDPAWVTRLAELDPQRRQVYLYHSYSTSISFLFILPYQQCKH